MQVKEKEKERVKKKSDPIPDSSDDCGVCGKPEKPEEDWICCDMCCLWYHRECVGLENNDDWLYSSDPDAIYTCPMCI